LRRLARTFPFRPAWSGVTPSGVVASPSSLHGFTTLNVKPIIVVAVAFARKAYFARSRNTVVVCDLPDSLIGSPGPHRRCRPGWRYRPPRCDSPPSRLSEGDSWPLARVTVILRDRVGKILGRFLDWLGPSGILEGAVPLPALTPPATLRAITETPSSTPSRRTTQLGLEDHRKNTPADNFHGQRRRRPKPFFGFTASSTRDKLMMNDPRGGSKPMSARPRKADQALAIRAASRANSSDRSRQDCPEPPGCCDKAGGSRPTITDGVSPAEATPTARIPAATAADEGHGLGGSKADRSTTTSATRGGPSMLLIHRSRSLTPAALASMAAYRGSE